EVDEDEGDAHSYGDGVDEPPHEAVALLAARVVLQDVTVLLEGRPVVPVIDIEVVVDLGHGSASRTMTVTMLKATWAMMAGPSRPARWARMPATTPKITRAGSCRSCPWLRPK